MINIDEKGLKDIHDAEKRILAILSGGQFGSQLTQAQAMVVAAADYYRETYIAVHREFDRMSDEHNL